MKKKKWVVLLLCLTLAMNLLAGCGGDDKKEEDGKGDVITEEPVDTGSDPGDTLPEMPDYNAEDFFGCWEYDNYDTWIYIYGDGTFETFEETGQSTAGNYYIEDGALILEEVELAFTFTEDGVLMDSDGDTLFPSELPAFSSAVYFEENGIPMNYEVDHGDMEVEDAVAYYGMNTEGQYYSTAPLVASVYQEEVENLGDGTIQTTYEIYLGLLEEYVPMFEDGVSTSVMMWFFDYYTGYALPTNDIFRAAGENEYYYEFEIDGEWTSVYIALDVNETEDAEGYQLLYQTNLTVITPEGYDGLVLSIPPQADSYEGLQSNRELESSLDTYVQALELPFDLYNGMNCSLW